MPLKNTVYKNKQLTRCSIRSLCSLGRKKRCFFAPINTALCFKIKMNHASEQVRKFYEVIWNQRNKQVIPEVLAEEFVFRGSLGQEKYGHVGFEEYLDMVHNALENYECHIIEMVIESEKIFVKLKFSGIHRNKFMGYAPTGKNVSWEGAALFHFSEGLVNSLWVLGDLKTLEQQLANEKT